MTRGSCNVDRRFTAKFSDEDGSGLADQARTVKTGFDTPTPGIKTELVTATVNNVTITARDFLGRVVPWPVGGIGYALHYSMVKSCGGKDIVTGKPFRDMAELLKARQASSSAIIRRPGLPISALKQKSIWTDIGFGKSHRCSNGAMEGGANG